MERRKIFWVSVLGVLFLCNLMIGASFAGGIVKANGTLTSVEDDRIVMIDEKGYEISRSAEIVDHEGNRISLRQLPLPVKVDYLYEFTKDGPIIIQLKEIPKIVPK